MLFVAKDDGSLLPEDFELSDEDFRVFEEVVKGLGDDFDPSHILTFAVAAQKDFCLYEDISDDELAHADVNVKQLVLNLCAFMNKHKNMELFVLLTLFSGR